MYSVSTEKLQLKIILKNGKNHCFRTTAGSTKHTLLHLIKFRNAINLNVVSKNLKQTTKTIPETLCAVFIKLYKKSQNIFPALGSVILIKREAILLTDLSEIRYKLRL